MLPPIVFPLPAPLRATLVALAAPLALAACGGSTISAPSVPNVVKPYRMDIQQGNFISPEMVAQLKAGMTKEQVRYVLGTPLVTDIFHADRWDYVYYRELREGKREQRALSVVFEGGKLARVIGDILPSETAKPAAKPEAAPPAAAAKPPAAPAKPEAPKPAPAATAEAPKPAAPAPAGGNWRSESDAGGPQAEAPKAAPKSEAPQAAPNAEEKKPEPAAERGFFGRMLEKIGF